jgi:hypothetical protein
VGRVSQDLPSWNRSDNALSNCQPCAAATPPRGDYQAAIARATRNAAAERALCNVYRHFFDRISLTSDCRFVPDNAGASRAVCNALPLVANRDDPHLLDMSARSVAPLAARAGALEMADAMPERGRTALAKIG